LKKTNIDIIHIEDLGIKREAEDDEMTELARQPSSPLIISKQKTYQKTTRLSKLSM